MRTLLGDRKISFADIGIINFQNFLFVAVQKFKYSTVIKIWLNEKEMRQLNI